MSQLFPGLYHLGFCTLITFSVCVVRQGGESVEVRQNLRQYTMLLFERALLPFSGWYMSMFLVSLQSVVLTLQM